MWDTNGATANASAGATAPGTWDQNTTAFWTTNTGGTVATSTWQALSAANGLAFFSAGATATGAYTVTVSGNVTGFRGITFEEGNVSVAATAGGTLTMSGNSVFTTNATNQASVAAVVAGAFSVTKAGATVLTLSGANTYTGATAINLGTLKAGVASVAGVSGAFGNNSAVTLANAAGVTMDITGFDTQIGSLAGAGGTGGTVTLGAVTLTTGGNNTSTNFAGTITGTGGSFTKTGTGVQTLSGATANTYSGTTTINAGGLTLQKTAGVNAIAGNITIGDGAGTDTLTLAASNQIADTSAVTLNAAGTPVFNLAGFAERVGSIASSNTGASITLGANGALTAGDASNTTYAGAITGTGTASFTKEGAGTTILSGTNTYAGTTTINAGTLQIGNAGTTGTLGAGTVTNNANLTINRSNAITIANAISGTGALNQTGAGTTTLTGANTYTGTTTISAGTLQVGNAGTTGTLGTGDVTNNANLTINRSNTITIANVIGGSGSFTQAGAGTTTLSGTTANTFLGTTTINAGGLTLQKTAGVNAIAGNITIGDGAGTDTLTLAASNQIADTSAVTLNAAGTPVFNLAGFAERVGSIASSNTGASITLGANGALTAGDASNTTYAGAITGTGTASFTKEGAGTTILSGTNTYAGITTINAGTLQFAKTSALYNSTPASWTATNLVVASGATAAFNVGGAGEFTSANIDTLKLLGTAGGGFRNGSTLGLDTTNAGGSFSYATAISNTNAGANVLGFTKLGTGTLILTGANTYSGTTTISAGTLQIGNAGTTGTLGHGAVTNNATLSFNRTDSQTIANAISGTGALTQAGSGTTILTGANTYAGTTTVSAGILQVGNAGTSGTLGTGGVTNNANLTFNRTDGLTVANTINGSGSITQAGTGSTTLSGTNGFTGGATVSAGTLVLQNSAAIGSGTVGTTVSSGATLRLDGGVTAANNGTLSLAGTSALIGANSNNRWSGNLALTNDATISNSGAGYLALGTTSPAWNRAINDPLGNTPYTPGFEDVTTFSLGANTLTLTGTTSAGDNRAIYVNARMTGSGNVVIDMTNPADIARYTANVNTYTGSTTVKNGTLSMSTTYNTYPGDTVNPGYFGINGALIVGDGTGSANTARYSTGTGTTNSELINYTSSLTLFKDGQVNLNASQTFTGVTFNGGAIDLGTAGGLYLNDTVTVNASAGNTATITGTGTSTISLTIHQGPVPVPNADRTFNIVGGAGNLSDLTLNAVVNNGSITKTGIGTMSIINSNFGGYEGTTTINNGILNIQHGDALGQASNNPATATTVNSGGTLELSNVANGNFTSNSGEQLYLNGTGYLTNGALRNYAGNNTWSGSTFLTTNSRIQSESGSLLTLTGTMNSSSNSTLDVRGAGDTTISGTIGTGSGGITKYGTGTLTLSGTNTYSGTTEIRVGVLSLQNSAGLGGLGTTTVFSNAALHLDSTAHGDLLGGDATTINGTGIGGTGAIRNIVGANNYTGQITINAPSLVTANNATTLTLSGGTTGADQNLTVGTTAENGNVIISGAMTNSSGQLTKEGSGDLTFGKSTGITGTVGLTHLNKGTLTVGLDTGTLSTLNTKAIDSALGTVLKIGSSGKVLATYDTDATMFGTIDEISASGGTFEKAGAGTLTFATTFNFAGNLILSGGTLALSNGANVTFGNIYITQNMTIDFGSGTSTVLTSANLYIAAGVQVSVLNWVNNGAGGSDDIWYATNGFQNFTGTPASPTPTTSAVLDATNTNPQNQITFTGIAPASNTSWVTVQGGQYYDHEIRPIPEPSTYGALFLGGCLGLFGWRRFRRQRATGA